MWVMGTDRQALVDGRSTRWEKHNRRRREVIIDAALAVVEELPPGADVHVAQIARRAGMARPAVYRHFADRAELDRAVQERVIAMLVDQLASPDLLTGPIGEVIHNIVGTYVGWAEQHESLHHLVLGTGAGERSSPIRQGLGELVLVIRPLLLAGVTAFGASFDDDDAAAVDLIVVGLVSEVIGAVRHWLERPRREPSAEVVTRFLAETVWHQFDGHARARGAVLEPTRTLEELIESALSAGDRTVGT